MRKSINFRSLLSQYERIWFNIWLKTIECTECDESGTKSTEKAHLFHRFSCSAMTKSDNFLTCNQFLNWPWSLNHEIKVIPSYCRLKNFFNFRNDCNHLKMNSKFKIGGKLILSLNAIFISIQVLTQQLI